MTSRNTDNLVSGDFYILKFNFDLRKSNIYSGKFKYNLGSTGSGDTIFMSNCRTILLRVGGIIFNFVASGSSATNILLQGIFYNPPIQLSST